MTINSGQMGALDVGVSIVHDLRNPLAAIHAGAETLAGASLPEPQVQRIARNMYRASVHIRELLEALLDHSRGADIRVEPTGLGELVADAVDRIAISAEFQSVEVIQAIPTDLILALDRHRMHRVLVNLLVNALEAMPNGGTIRISAVSSCHSVLIRVSDTGPGIAPEIQERLFRPFVTAGKADGIGLGLALSRQTVFDHGGEMWVEPSTRGACFALRLPRAI